MESIASHKPEKETQFCLISIIFTVFYRRKKIILMKDNGSWVGARRVEYTILICWPLGTAMLRPRRLSALTWR